MDKLVYVACCYPNETNDRYKVEVPDIPGLSFESENFETAINMASIKASTWALNNIENGKVLPSPSTINDLTLKDDSGFFSLISFDTNK